MKITGLITEYNPFHNGHAYHLEKARALTGADAIVAVMSGDFVQRGEPAVTDKYARTRMALAAGVDAVFELPVVTATASAEGFAAGAVSLLAGLGVTDIVYGSEADESEHGLLLKLAGILSEEPDEYKVLLSAALKSGANFPKARRAAAAKLAPELAPLLDSPNNILGIEYEKAAIRLAAERGLAPVLHNVRRSGDGHLKTGSDIREAIFAAGGSPPSSGLYGNMPDTTAGGNLLCGLVPQTTLDNLSYTICPDDFSQLLFYKLSISSAEALTDCLDVSPEIANRIMGCYKDAGTFGELVQLAAARNFTESRIRRALLHILLEIRSGETAPDFARVLGFRENSPVMRLLKERTHLPIVTKLADAPGSREADSRAAEIYNRVVYARYGITLPDEYRAGVVIYR